MPSIHRGKLLGRLGNGAIKATIIINNYNYGRFLVTAIESALDQTYADTEVVVVDDGSTDDSRHIIAGYGNRIRPVLKANGGQASAFNAGFAASTDDVIRMLDSDDLFYPNKVERIARTFESYPEIRWVFHPVCREYEDGRRKPTPPLQRALYMDIREPALRGKLPEPPGPVTSGIVLSRTMLDRILPMPESIRITADNYLIFLAAALERGVYLDDVLALQCIHGSNNYTVRRDRTLTQARVLSFNYPQHATAIPCTVHSEQRHLLHSAWDYVRALRRDPICEPAFAG
jgi:glycosyltransferase involved in cell wall biosynthesis